MADTEVTDISVARAKRKAASEACDHGVSFDSTAASTMTSSQVRKAFPRLDGKCPKGCGYVGIAYASFEHYTSGDW